MNLPVTEVAVGVLLDPGRNRVLLARRPPGVHLGDCWEFPGGKLEQGESCEAALERELHEELGILVGSSWPLIRLQNVYADRVIRLNVRMVDAYTGTPYGREGQKVRWVECSKLSSVPFPPANRPIVKALLLPDLFGILNVFDHARSELPDLLRRMAAQGVGMVRLREGSVPLENVFVSELAELARSLGLPLLITGTPERVRLTGASGLHLRSTELHEPPEPALLQDLWRSASCHDLSDLQRALDLQVDFAVLGPVLPTASHPEARGMGWAAFSDLVGSVNLPVFALGGLDITHLQKAKIMGGRGIAAVRAFVGDAHG